MASVELVGRDAEREQILAAWERAREGFGSVVVLSGEPGIGKSALVDAVSTAVATGGAEVVRGRAWEAGDAPAYFPVWPCLRALGLPLPGDEEGADTPRGVDFHRWEAVLAGLASASANRPFLWVVEDLHAADGQTLDLLSFLAQPLRSTRAMVLATMRSSDPRLDEATMRRVARIVREAEEIRLRPLGRDEVRRLVAERVRNVPDEVVDQLAERTGGNPLFVIECARGLSANADNRFRFVSLPPTVAASVCERVDLLPDASRAAVHDAAVLGDEAFSGTLARMADVQPAVIIDALVSAVRAGVLTETAPGRYRFVHAVVRDVIYEAQPGDRRVDAHARACDALAATGSASDTVEMAHHALSSLTPGRAEHTREAVQAAVKRLQREGTHDRAHRLIQRLLEASAAGHLPPATVEDLLMAATAARAAGRFAQAEAHAIDALELARRCADPIAFAEAAMVFGANLRPGAVNEALVRALQEALALLPEEASASRCRVRARLAAALQPAVDPQMPVELARAAIADAKAIDDAPLLCEVLYFAGSAMTDFAPPHEVRELADELLALAREADDAARTLRAYARLVVEDLHVGDLYAFDAHVDAMLTSARSVGDPNLLWRPLLLASMRACARGDFADSERLIAQVAAHARVTDDPALDLSLGAHQMMRALLLYDGETYLAGLERLAPFPDVPRVDNIIQRLRAECAIHFRDTKLAATSGEATTPAPLWQQPHPDVRQGDVVALVGTPEACRKLVDAISPWADYHLCEGHIPMVYMGPVRAILARLQRRAGDTAAAEESFRDALEEMETHGFRPWAARMRLELGELLLELGRPEGAELLQAAAEEADALGLTWLADTARAGESAARGERPGDAASKAELSMHLDGSVWQVSLGERSVQLPDNRGLQLLARLVQRPTEEVHVLTLASDGPAPIPDTSAGELLDEKAIASYRKRLADLDAKLEDARERAIVARIERLEREREFLEREVARAIGLGGKRRSAGSASERARVNVRRRLKDAITRIDKLDDAIGGYLRRAVRTGTYCTFRP